MKTELHPAWYPEATVTCQCGNTWTTGATVPEIRTEICSACHPFFTGEQRIVDTEGRVDKFIKRLQRRDALRENVETQREGEALPTDVSIDELGLSKRFTKVLADNEVFTAGDILKLFEDEGDDGVLGFSGIGQAALIEIKKSLRSQGFELPVEE